MQWIVLAYSLPSKGSSSPRVTLWRRLRRLGAIMPAGGMHVLPARDECAEAFQWLAQEIRQARGEAVVMHVNHFEGLTDQELIGRFQAARTEEYGELDRQAVELEEMLRQPTEADEHERLRGALEKLQRRYAEVVRVDYFDCPEGARVAARLTAIGRALSPLSSDSVRVAAAELAEYQAARWVTRPRPHVDRLACAWLIRRYINPAAAIRYDMQPEPGEVSFDMADARFSHQGNLCTFETMLQAFALDEPALRSMAEIVHEIDLRDGRFLRPETAGIDAVLQGWLHVDLTDAERESAGIALFEGLYAALTAAPPARAVDAEVGPA